MTNAEENVWTAEGGFVLNQSLFTFFGSSKSTNLSWPRILFDNATGTWIASAFDGNESSVLLAASVGPDPLGEWTVYDIPAYPNYEPLEPFIGVSAWMLGISSNDLNRTTLHVDGTGYTLVNLTDLRNGATLAYYSFNPEFWLPNARAESAGTPSSLQWFGGLNAAANSVFWVNFTSAPPLTPTYRTAGVKIAAFTPPPPAAQPGTVDLLNTTTGDNRPSSAEWQNDLQTLAFTTGSGCGVGLSCVDLVQVWTTNGTLRQDDAVVSPSEFLFYPSVGLDHRGDLTVAAGVSSSSEYPSVTIFGQAWNEPDTISLGAFTAVTGTAAAETGCDAHNVCPYGQYFAAAPDPVSPLIWTAGEYGEAGSRWATWIESASTSGASISAAAAPGAIDLGEQSNLTAVGSGGASPLGDYSWNGLPAGCESQDVPVLACRPSVTGSFEVTVTANDSYPVAASATFPFVIASRPVVSAPRPSSPGADVGENRSFSVSASLGTSPYEYAWSGLSGGSCVGGTTSVVTCSFESSGALVVRVSVTDAAGVQATSPALNFSVAPALSVSVPSSSTTTFSAGSSVTISVVVTGGSGGDEYAWSGLPDNCASSDSASIHCSPATVGTYNVSVAVTDSNGGRAQSPPLSLKVTAALSGGPLGLPGDDGWIAIGVLLAAAAIAAGGLLAGRKRPPPARDDARVKLPPDPPAEGMR